MNLQRSLLTFAFFLFGPPLFLEAEDGGLPRVPHDLIERIKQAKAATDGAFQNFNPSRFAFNEPSAIRPNGNPVFFNPPSFTPPKTEALNFNPTTTRPLIDRLPRKLQAFAREFLASDDEDDSEEFFEPFSEDSTTTASRRTADRKPLNSVRLQPVDAGKPSITMTLSGDVTQLDDVAMAEVVQKAKVISSLTTNQFSNTRAPRTTLATSTRSSSLTSRRTTRTTSRTSTQRTTSMTDNVDYDYEDEATTKATTKTAKNENRSPDDKKNLTPTKKSGSMEDFANSLMEKFGVTLDQVRNQLPEASKVAFVKQTCISDETPLVSVTDPFGEPPECAKQKFRTFDGRCNNIAFSGRGTAGAPLTRLLAPNYADSRNSPRIAKSGKELPSARVISTQVGGTKDSFQNETTVLFMQFGQLIDHDITNTARPSLSCCNEDMKNDPRCFNIKVPKNDAIMDNPCMIFERSRAANRSSCPSAPREQLNLVTAYIDGSAIYGSSTTKAKSLRDNENGTLSIFSPSKTPNYHLPPLNPDDNGCQIPTEEEKKCFRAGDARANVHLGMANIQTLFLRHHNFIANQLREINSQWGDEKVFQETRHIVAAQLQHITYNEFLPLLLGNELLDEFNLRLLPSGRFMGYNVSVHAGIINEFATAAYRIGHTMVPNTFRRMSKDYKFKGDEQLQKTYFHPVALYDKDVFDELMLGMLGSPHQAVDSNFVDDLNNHLFKNAGERFGQDLTALNIQRGRDHGLPGYMKFREVCGLATASNFEELRAMKVMPDDIVDKMAQQYEDVEDIDVYIAGSSEFLVKGGKVGPTFGCIIAEQFRRLRVGDRFWYENDLPLSSAFSNRQLAALRTTTMARIVCDNTPLVEIIQPKAFLLPDPKTNPLTHCDEIAGPNLKVWKTRPKVSAAKIPTR